MAEAGTIQTEDLMMAPFFNKQSVSIERGEGVYVYDENGKRYLDFTAGWGVTSIGHAHPVITEALHAQAGKIIQNPNAGRTYSPARAQLLTTLRKVLPDHLSHVFFTNSGAEANDAAIKLARKITGRSVVVSTEAMAAKVSRTCLADGLLVTRTNGTGIRIFPALTISKDELRQGLAVLDRVIAAIQEVF